MTCINVKYLEPKWPPFVEDLTHENGMSTASKWGGFLEFELEQGEGKQLRKNSTDHHCATSWVSSVGFFFTAKGQKCISIVIQMVHFNWSFFYQPGTCLNYWKIPVENEIACIANAGASDPCHPQDMSTKCLTPMKLQFDDFSHTEKNRNFQITFHAIFHWRRPPLKKTTKLSQEINKPLKSRAPAAPQRGKQIPRVGTGPNVPHISWNKYSPWEGMSYPPWK